MFGAQFLERRLQWKSGKVGGWPIGEHRDIDWPGAGVVGDAGIDQVDANLLHAQLFPSLSQAQAEHHLRAMQRDQLVKQARSLRKNTRQFRGHGFVPLFSQNLCRVPRDDN